MYRNTVLIFECLTPELRWSKKLLGTRSKINSIRNDDVIGAKNRMFGKVEISNFRHSGRIFNQGKNNLIIPMQYIS